MQVVIIINNIPVVFQIPQEVFQTQQHINQGLPREVDHGWWNCEGCRNSYHQYNLLRVLKDRLRDGNKFYYTIPYLEDMLKWTVEREMFEQSAIIRDVITRRKNILKIRDYKIISKIY